METLERPLQIMADSAQELYINALEAIQHGEEVSSVRDCNSVGCAWGTRERPTKELRHVSLFLTNPRNRVISAPLVSLERMIPRTILATLSDEVDLEALAFYDPKAREFSDDGKTLMTNYGYRVRHFDQIDQIEQVVAQFKKDPNTRRAVIHVHAVRDAERKYDPCIDSLHFLIRNGSLECQSFWRSENVLSLMPVNIFEFSMLQELIASELGIPPGMYVQTVTSLHYYLDDEEKLKKTIESFQKWDFPAPMEPMPEKSLRQIELVRKYEKQWRLSQPSKVGFYSDDEESLTDYWKAIADVVAYSIAKKTNQAELLKQLARFSPWEELLK